MRYLKRLMAVPVIFIMLLALVTGLFPTDAKAIVQISVSSSPDRLQSSGYVRVEIEINNVSVNVLEDIQVTTSNGSTKFGGKTIAPGAKETIIINDFYVDESRLGGNIPFIVMWTENSKLQTRAVNLYIGKDEAPSKPDPTKDVTPTDPPRQTAEPAAPTDSPVAPELFEYMSINCSADKVGVDEGGTVVFTYSLRNISNETLTNVTLRDDVIMGASPHPEVNGITLAPNESRKVEYTYTMGNASVTSMPYVSYAWATGSTTQYGPGVTVNRISNRTDVTVNMGETTAEGTKFTIDVTNDSTTPLTGLLIRDDKGAIVADGETIDPGQSASFEHIIAPDVTREVFFTVTADGGFSYTTSKYPVYAYVDPSLVDVDFSIEVVEYLNENGNVVLKFTAVNNGTLNLSKLMITEGANEIGSMDDLAAGGTVTASYSVNVGTGRRNLNFKLTAYDENDKPWNFETTMMADSFGGAQQQTSIRTNLNVGGAISDVLSTILIILAVIAGLSGAALLTLAILEKRSNGGFGRKPARGSGGNG